MKIESMKLDDIDQVIEIEKECFNDPWPREAFIQDIELNKDAEAIVLKDEDKIIGYYHIWYMFDNADLTNVVIRKSYQGRKLGEFLLKDCIKRCIRKNVEFLHLEVRVDNQRAINLYKKLGFIDVRIRKGYYAGVDGIDMVKGLLGLSEEDIGD